MDREFVMALIALSIPFLLGVIAGRMSIKVPEEEKRKTPGNDIIQ